MKANGTLSKIIGGMATSSAEINRQEVVDKSRALIMQTNSVDTDSNDELGETTVIEEGITLEEDNKKLVYKIKGISNQKMFGFVPVLIEKTVNVSAETGTIGSTQTPLFDRFIDLLSF